MAERVWRLGYEGWSHEVVGGIMPTHDPFR